MGRLRNLFSKSETGRQPLIPGSAAYKEVYGDYYYDVPAAEDGAFPELRPLTYDERVRELEIFKEILGETAIRKSSIDESTQP